MSTGLWPFVLDSGLFLLPCVCSISAEIMCRVFVFSFFLPALFDLVAWYPFGFSVGGSNGDRLKKLKLTSPIDGFGCD